MNKREVLLTAIKNSTLQRHLISLTQQPHPKPKAFTPFQVYQYEESVDYDHVERMIQEQILTKFNKELFQEEEARLKMELFGLQEAIEIEDNEIAMLRLLIQTERSNIKAEQMAQLAKMQTKRMVNQSNTVQNAGVQSLKEDGDLKDNSRFAIYPCVRVDLDPPKQPTIKTIPAITIPQREEKEFPAKSHRQMLATYTKRSLASSQEHPQPLNDHKNIPKFEDNDKTIKPQSKPNQSDANLNGLHRKISFLERAWEKAKAQGQRKLCKRYKSELIALIGQFWQATK